MFLTKWEKTVWAVRGKGKAEKMRRTAYMERERERESRRRIFISFNDVVI